MFARSTIAASVFGLATVAATGVFTPTVVEAAPSDWEAFIIRHNASPTTPLTITENVEGDGVTTQIDEASEKTGYGTNFFDGQSIRTVGSVSYDRLDAGTKTPYVNIWVTDGTRYAVVAPNVYNSYGAGGAPITPNVNGKNIQDLGVNIYETDTSDLSWLTPGGVYNAAFQGLATFDGTSYTPVKVSDLYASLTVYGNTTYGGTGATKSGDGFALVFGDTQGNFTSAIPYEVDNVSVTAVPEPATLGLLAVGAIALLGRKRRAV